MRGIQEFSAAGVDRVQGGTFPARIWGAFMEDVGLAQFEFADWDRPDPQPRGPARLFLPGNECVYEIVGYQPAPTVPAAEPPPASAPPQGFRLPSATPTTEPATPPATTVPAEPATPPATTVPAETTTTTTLPPVPIYAPVETGTTIPPDVLDPNAPLPSIPLEQVVRPC
jgi:penicillin-binding protein 1A